MPARIQSPPKRMTRSRAKAVDDIEVPAKPTTRASKAPTKAGAISTKRKTRTDDAEDELAQEEVGEWSGEGKQEEVAVNDAAIQNNAGAQRKATRATGGTVSTANKFEGQTGTRGRGRPRRAVSTRQMTDVADQGLASAPATRTTRARAASVTVVEQDLQTQQAPLRSNAAKKKVSFAEDESEKENAAQPVLSKKTTALSTTAAKLEKPGGLNAKPIRGAATRGRGAARGGRMQRNAPRALPLSPRKNAQVTVPTQTRDDEPQEQAAQIPEGQLHKSPIKPAASLIHPATPGHTSIISPTKQRSEVMFGQSVDELQESTTLLRSPAKRLGPDTSDSPSRSITSPIKGLLAQSPSKPTGGLTQVAVDEAQREFTASVMVQPARKFPMSAPATQPVFDISKQSLSQSAMFGSPAKRPASPIKGMHFGSSRKPSATTEGYQSSTASGVRGTPRKLLSPMKASSAFRAKASPGAALKVHKMTDEEQAQMLEDELASSLSPFSPVKAVTQPLTPHQTSKIPVRSPPRSAGKTNLLSTTVDASEAGAQSNATPGANQQDEDNSAAHPPINFTSTPFRIMRADIDDGSDDELSYDRIDEESPLVGGQAHAVDGQSGLATPKPQSASDGPMTALAKRFGDWQGASPDKGVLQQRRVEGSVFSAPQVAAVQRDSVSDLPTAVQDNPSRASLSFEDAIAIHVDEEEDATMLDIDDFAAEGNPFWQSQRSDASQEYGDENVMPIDPALLREIAAEDAARMTLTPAKLIKEPLRVLHTVSKVPLKPAADDHTPYQKPARRGHSLAATLSPQAELELALMRQCHPLPSQMANLQSFHRTEQQAGRSSKFAEMLDEDETEVDVTPTPGPSTPATHIACSSVAATPAPTPRPGLDIKLLAGAVVFVDVHTSEGADASGIFVELLTQMGARCVKHWSWNPRGSLDGCHSAGDLEDSGSPKVGITHVVFKDGGKRTMEKVREARGLVLCVGVGWVLDCEKESKWLDEGDYAIDISTIPRGGSRRRKSMEPTSLRNAVFSPVKPSSSDVMSPTKEFLNLGTPTPRKESLQQPVVEASRMSFVAPSEVDIESPASTPTKQAQPEHESVPSTPQTADTYASGGFRSPVTPYFLHPQQLVQQTCPPKQTQQLFFPISGRIQDEPNEDMRKRLSLARRKSMQFAPRTSSPLARAYSHQ